MSREEIDAMGNAEKILLVERIWDSIDKSSMELTDAQRKELDRRLDKHANGDAEYSTWEEVKKRLHNRA